MGFTTRPLLAASRDGDWHEVRRGAVRRPATSWDSLHALRPAPRPGPSSVAYGAECPAVLSHISAAIEHGAEVWDIDLADVVHITRLDGRAGRREAGVGSNIAAS